MRAVKGSASNEQRRRRDQREVQPRGDEAAAETEQSTAHSSPAMCRSREGCTAVEVRVAAADRRTFWRERRRPLLWLSALLFCRLPTSQLRGVSGDCHISCPSTIPLRCSLPVSSAVTGIAPNCIALHCPTLGFPLAPSSLLAPAPSDVSPSHSALLCSHTPPAHYTSAPHSHTSIARPSPFTRSLLCSSVHPPALLSHPR